MASPFHVFRKHQRVILVVTGLLAMISFVFLGPLMDVIGGGGGGQYENPVVVRTSYGKLRRSDVDRMRMMQNILIDFLNRAAQESFRKHGSNRTGWRGRNPEVSEQGAVESMLLAKKAERMGIVISDEVINQKLEQFELTEEEMMNVLSGARIHDRPVRMDDIFEAYRQLLLADEVLRMYSLPTPENPNDYLFSSQAPTAPTPAEYWERFRRLNEEVRIETVAVPAKDFFDKIPDPSVAELEKFFEEHKDRLNLPDMIANTRMTSPTPGFKVPQKVQFRYLEGNYLQFQELAEAAVTDEEIAKYYEDHKKDFEDINLLQDPAAAEQSPSVEGAPPEPEEPAAETPAADAPAPEKPAEKSDSTEPAAEQPKDDKPAEEKPTDEKPTDEKPAEPQSALTGVGRTQFVSFQADDEGAAAEEPQKDEPAPAEPAKETPAASEPAPGETPADKPTEPAPAAETPAAKDAAQPDEPPLDIPKAQPQDLGKPDAAKPEAGKPTEKKEEPKYRPLAEVAPEIRKLLGQQRAAGLMIDTIKPIADELIAYWRPSVRDKLAKGDQGVSEFPPGLKEKIDKAHLVLKRTDLIAPDQLIEIPLGQARMEQSGQPFYSVGFSPTLKPYQLVGTVDSDGDLVDDGNRYLIWKVKEEAERVPTLDEVRQDVIRAWKLPKALKMAKEAADKLAVTAKSRPGVPLERALADEKGADGKGVEVVVSEPFSWLTQGNVAFTEFNSPMRLSKVDGVEGAGPEFMKAVFAMKNDEVGVLVNYPQDAAYVTRIQERVRPPEALRTEFLDFERRGDLRRMPWAIQAKSEDVQQVYAALIREVEEESSVEWEVPPDQMQEQQE